MIFFYDTYNCIIISTRERLLREVIGPIRRGDIDVNDEIVRQIQGEFFPNIAWVNEAIR